MKFEDIIVAVVSLTVAFFLFDCLLNFPLVPANTEWGGMIAVIVSILISSLVVGYVFAGKIQEESRRASIGKIAILFAAVMGFIVIMVYGALFHYGPLVDQMLTNNYGSSKTLTWTYTDWFGYELMYLTIDVALFIVYAIVFGFIGLYAGSMRKPSEKTKE